MYPCVREQKQLLIPNRRVQILFPPRGYNFFRKLDYLKDDVDIDAENVSFKGTENVSLKGTESVSLKGTECVSLKGTECVSLKGTESVPLHKGTKFEPL